MLINGVVITNNVASKKVVISSESGCILDGLGMVRSNNILVNTNMVALLLKEAQIKSSTSTQIVGELSIYLQR